MRESPRPHQTNRLLRMLPPDELKKLEPHLSAVWLEANQTVYEVEVALREVYFPVGAVCSNIIVMEDGAGAETNSIGAEGMVGAHAALGSYTIGAKMICQIAGYAYRMPLAEFTRYLASLPIFRDLLARYNVTLLQVVSQTAACNRLHHANQRLARWLLMTDDRVFNGSFKMTHEFLSLMLGVNRPAVTVAATELQDAGLISYTRGVVRIIDRKGLEAASCECYRIVTHLFEILLPNGVSAPPIRGRLA